MKQSSSDESILLMCKFAEKDVFSLNGEEALENDSAGTIP